MTKQDFWERKKKRVIENKFVRITWRKIWNERIFRKFDIKYKQRELQIKIEIERWKLNNQNLVFSGWFLIDYENAMILSIYFDQPVGKV